MNKRVVKWVSPGLATVLGSAALALLMSGAHGAPSAPDIIQPTTLDIAQADSIVTLEPPRIQDYWMSATRQSGGVIVFDGYAPDEATRKRLSEVDNADTNYLKLGRGAPQAYQAAADFGLAVLARLSEGRFALRDNIVTFTGIAGSTADYDALAKLIAAGAPQGLVLARSEIKAAALSPYTWSATKADGKVTLSGSVPDPAAKAELATAIGSPSTTAVTYASGEPAGFVASAATALDLLQWLDTGAATYDGTAWTISGTPATAIDKGAIEADFVVRKLAAAGWTLDIAAPPAPPTPVEPPAPPKTKPQAAEPVVKPPEATEPTAPAVEPVAEPAASAPAIDPAYTFSANRAADGATTMSGQLPADPALRFFSVITGAPTTDVTIAPGAPDDFILSAETGLRALTTLESGQLRFADGQWSLSGKATDAAASAALKATIAALPTGAAWILAITTPPALDACQAAVAGFSTRNAILFQSGAAVIADESAPALDELAGYLAQCPEADVDIEGHTDADGDEQLNLALSVARAEAVVNALITRNIAPERLYAVGYGESTPIADNDTQAGKRLNRRIVVKVLQHHI